MNLEYFYQLMQLFGVLLGLIGIYIVFKIQSLDTSISSYRNNLIKSISLYRAVKDRVQCEENNAKGIKDERYKKTFDELVIYNSYVVDGSMDDDLENWVEKIIDDKEPISNLLKENFSDTLGKWKNRKIEKNKIISSMRYPIILTAGVILFALSIITNNSFELVNDILKASFISIVILCFIVFAFFNIIYISIYILKNLPQK